MEKSELYNKKDDKYYQVKPIFRKLPNEYIIKISLKMNSIKIITFVFLILIFLFFIYIIRVIEQKSHKKDITDNKNKVSILMTMSKYYIYAGMVSISSALYNAKNTTYLEFHIFLSNNDSKKVSQLIESVKYRINNKSEFHFYYLNDSEFKDIIQGRHPSSFYRLKAAELIKNLSKILYIDCDTLILKDLNELYNLDIGNNYMLGTLEAIAGSFFRGKKFDYDYINSGVLLMNLTKMRNDKIYEKFKEYALNSSNRENIVFGDQCLINIICKGKIGILKPKYSSINIYDSSNQLKLSNQNSSLAYSSNEREEAFKNGFIIHFKMWKQSSKPNYRYQWWNKYAKISRVYKIIAKNKKLSKKFLYKESPKKISCKKSPKKCNYKKLPKKF